MKEGPDEVKVQEDQLLTEREELLWRSWCQYLYWNS